MACFTVVTVDVPNTELNREAREALELPLDERLTLRDAKRVRIEAGVIKTKREIRKLQPTAVIRRTGNKLTVTVTA